MEGWNEKSNFTPELTACVRRAMLEQVGALVLGTSLQPDYNRIVYAKNGIDARKAYDELVAKWTPLAPVPSIYSSARRCLRCLLLVMCTHPFAKKALTLHLARSEGHERYFGCNLMHRKVLASFHQHLMAEAPALNSSAGFNSPPWLNGGRHRPASSRNRLDAVLCQNSALLK